MKTLIVNVTQEHINSGGRRCTDCPIALAFKSAGLPNARVGGYYFRESQDHGPNGLPSNVEEWISAYDRYGPTAVSPISFTVELL